MRKISPLKYPGSKAKVIAQITPLLPVKLERLVSIFFGGGSLELNLADTGLAIIGYDADPGVSNFWTQLIADAKAVSRHALVYNRIPRATLPADLAAIADPAERAGAFFAMNKASFRGLTYSPISRDAPEHMMTNLAAYTTGNITVACADFTESIPAHPRDFLFCDPPYDCQGNFYSPASEHNRHFGHLALRDLLADRDNWLLTYSATPRIRLLYEGFPSIPMEQQFKFNNSFRDSNEVVILARNLESDLTTPLLWN